MGESLVNIVSYPKVNRILEERPKPSQVEEMLKRIIIYLPYKLEHYFAFGNDKNWRNKNGNYHTMFADEAILRVPTPTASFRLGFQDMMSELYDYYADDYHMRIGNEPYTVIVHPKDVRMVKRICEEILNLEVGHTFGLDNSTN